MPTDAQREANRRYKGKRERLDLILYGVTKAEIDAHILEIEKRTGKRESRNAFINRCIASQIAQDNAQA